MEPQENETIHIEREAPPQTRWSGLGTRTTSAIVLIAIVFFALLCVYPARDGRMPYYDERMEQLNRRR